MTVFSLGKSYCFHENVKEITGPMFECVTLLAKEYLLTPMQNKAYPFGTY